MFSMCIYTGEYHENTAIPAIVIKADNMASLLEKYVTYITSNSISEHNTEIIYIEPEVARIQN